MGAIEEKDGEVWIRVRVQPKASRNAFCREPDGRLRVALTAPPVDGAANKALRVFVAKFFKVSKSSVRLVSGEKSREKCVALQGVTQQAVEETLACCGEI